MLDVKLVRKRQTNYPEVFKAINRNFLPKAGVIIQSEVQRRMKVEKIVDTGRLRSSVRFRVSKDQVAIGTNVEYAVYNEFGTVKMAARPTWRPALDENRKALVKLWATTYNKVFRILGGRS